MAEQPNVLSVLVLPFFLKLLQEVESKKKKKTTLNIWFAVVLMNLVTTSEGI